MSDTVIRLAKGSHPDQACDDAERCLFEWYNWLTRQAHTDSCPPGVSPVLHQFGMSLNDALPDDTRQQLARFLPNGTSPLAGTAGDGKDETRGFLALDWLIRTYLPAWLDLAGLADEATALQELEPIRHLEAAEAAGPVVRRASDKAAAAGAAAGAAAWAAAWAAAGAAARAAAWDAAWDAAGAAAWDAAGAAAGAAAWAAAGAAARDAAGDAARAAAWDAAGAAAWAAAGAAAWDAAWDKLAPVVARLQADAILLYEAMCDA
jgi:hypothetical protein